MKFFNQEKYILTYNFLSILSKKLQDQKGAHVFLFCYWSIIVSIFYNVFLLRWNWKHK